MDHLEESIRRCVKAAYRAWTEPGASGEASDARDPSMPPHLRSVRHVSWDEVDAFAEAALDLDAQVREELRRMGGPALPAQHSSRHRHRHRRAA